MNALSLSVFLLLLISTCVVSGQTGEEAPPLQYERPQHAMPRRYRDAQRYDLSYFNVDQGLRSSYLTTLCYDRRGMLWMGTDGGGVIRYDGETFETFSRQAGLASNFIEALYEDQKGRLWIGTLVGGLHCYDGKRLYNYTSEDGLAGDYVYTITEDRYGQLWVGTNEGISIYKDGKLRSFSDPDSLLHQETIHKLYYDKQNRLWMSTENGLFLYQQGALQRMEFSGEDLIVNTISEGEDGTIWFGTGYGLYACQKDEIKAIDITALNDRSLLASYVDEKGRVWLGVREGVFRYDPKTKSLFTLKEEDGLANNYTYAITGDGQGNIWLGTDGSGLFRYRENSFRLFSERDGLSSSIVWALFEDSDSTLLLGTDGGGIDRYREGTFQKRAMELPILSHLTISTIQRDTAGRIWVATSGDGIFVSENGEDFKELPTPHDVLFTTDLEIMENGEAWAATDVGLLHYDGTAFNEYLASDSLSSDVYWAIARDTENNLWLGTEGGGLLYLSQDSLRVFTTRNSAMPSDRIYHLLHDQEGLLWIGTDAGLVLYDGSTFRHLSEKNGLLHNLILSLQQDRSGAIWVGTEGGLHRLEAVSEAELTRIVPNRLAFGRYRIEQFGKQDGLKSIDAIDNAVLLDHRNQMWWGMGNVLTRLDLNTFRLPQEPPQKPTLRFLEIQQQFIDFNSLKNDTAYAGTVPFHEEVSYDSCAHFSNYPHHLELPYDLNHLTFHFAAIDWKAPHKVRYSYRLDGLEKAWSKPTAEHLADYRSLPPGNYTFEVRATGAAPYWSEAFRYSFRIRPPFWQTPLAYLIYALLGVLGVVGLVRRRTARLKKREATLKRLVKRRTAELESANAELSQTNEEINTMNDSLQRTLGIVREQHTKIQDSINYAQRIQLAALPTERQLQALPEHFILFRPRDVVSGDFYWMADLREKCGKIILAAVDCTGHGVPGAFMSLIGSNLLNQTVIEHGIYAPDVILHELHLAVQQALRQRETRNQDGMEMSLLVWDTEANELQFAGAKNGIFYIQDDKPHWIRGDRMGIGGLWKHEDERFTTHTIPLTGVTTCYLFSDGFQDQFGGSQGRKFMIRQLRDLLFSIHKEPLDEQKKRLEERLETWMEGYEQIDDIMVIGVRFR